MHTFGMLQTRKRVLINAFTARALRDTFSPARGAGIHFLNFLTLVNMYDVFKTLILPQV